MTGKSAVLVKNENELVEECMRREKIMSKVKTGSH